MTYSFETSDGETSHLSEPAAYDANRSGPVESAAIKESKTHGAIVIKIGGSTLGSHDPTLRSIAEAQKQGYQPVVVHGGGKLISEWMEKQGIRPRFVRGLRVTDYPSLEIVVAVLAGLVNKNIVAAMTSLGCKAIGLSGADGGILRARIMDPELGLVGVVTRVEVEPIRVMLEQGYIPVIAPVALAASEAEGGAGSLLNVNADTAAGQLAAALGAERMVLLTDVEGVLDASHRLIPRLTRRQAEGLISSNVAGGGMVPKLEACLAALSKVRIAYIVDGRKAGIIEDVLSDKAVGTRIS